MANTALPADRVKAACEKAAARQQVGGGDNSRSILSLLHLAAAAMSVSANAVITVSSDEFLLIADSW